MLKPSGLFQISFIGKEEIKELDFSVFEMFMEDVASDGCKNREDTLIFAVNGYDEDEKELFEETTINFTNVCGKEYVTTFVDNSADVSKVHVCLLVVIELKNKDIEIRETNKLEGVWLNKQQVLDLYDKFENWSKIAIDLLKIGMHE